MMQQSKTLHMVAFLLLVVGGLNWLLVGLLSFDLVMWLFVDLLGMKILAQIVYILVGLAAVYELLTHKSGCRACDTSGGGQRDMSTPGV